VRSPGEIWRQRLWVWLPALLFFLLNAGAFAVYKLGYAGRVESLQETLGAQEKTLADLKAKQREAQTMLARVRTNEQQVEQLYADRLSTRSRRLTGVTAEVKELARKAGLEPRSLSYPEEVIEEFGLIKRSFVFTVEGTYVELRKFINLLEVSRSFLSVDEATVASNASEGPELRVDLKISTLFARDEDAGAAVPAVPGAARTARAVPGGES
jgi:Tfp pilus assembly protein PilO